jgi:hypothetical protein
MDSFALSSQIQLTSITEVAHLVLIQSLRNIGKLCKTSGNMLKEKQRVTVQKLLEVVPRTMPLKLE